MIVLTKSIPKIVIKSIVILSKMSYGLTHSSVPHRKLFSCNDIL